VWLRRIGVAVGAAKRRSAGPAAAPIRLNHTGQAGQALGVVAWPTTDQIGDRTAARQVSILEAVLQLRLNEEIREKQGLAYAPNASSTSSDIFPGYGYLAIAAETTPESLPKLFDAVDAIVADLRDNPISEDELNRARRPAVERLRRSMADNAYWLNQLSEAQSDPASLDQTRNNIAVLEAVTAADLQRVAQLYLKPETAWRAEVVSDKSPVATPAQ